MSDEVVNPKARFGAAKVPVWGVPPISIIHEANAMWNGIEKYGAYNYRGSRIAVSTYISASLRHIFAYLDGEQLAPDSGVHHLGHAKACLGLLLDAEASGMLEDDRPPKSGAAVKLMKEITRAEEAKDN